jgi:hypothetical protein
MDFLQHYALSTGVASERKEDQHPHRWSSGVRWVNNALLLPRVLGKGWWCDAMQKDGKAGCFCKDLQVGRGRTCRASTGWSSLVGLKSQPSFFSQSKQARDHQSAKLEPAACSSSPRSNHPAKTMAYRRKQQGPVGADDRRIPQPQASGPLSLLRPLHRPISPVIAANLLRLRLSRSNIISGSHRIQLAATAVPSVRSTQLLLRRCAIVTG